MLKQSKKHKQMQTKQADVLHGQSSSKEANKGKSSQIIERREIEGSPFQCIKALEGWFLALGMHRLSEVHETYELALEELEYNKWNIVCLVSAIMVEKYKELEKRSILDLNENNEILTTKSNSL